MSDDMAAFGFSGLPFATGVSAAALAAVEEISAPARVMPRWAADLPKIGVKGLENPARAPYLGRAPRAPWTRIGVAGSRGREDMPDPAPPRAPGHGTAERTRRGAVLALPAERPAGIGDTGDANGDEA